VPYHYTADGLQELRATGMPLGLMSGMTYEEKETTLAPDDYVLLYSDGLVEAHAPDREMFGFPRLQALLAEHEDGHDLTSFLLDQLDTFTGPQWEQEDDVTLVTIQRLAAEAWQPLADFAVESAPGNERPVMTQVADLVADKLPPEQLEKLKTAVAEATMNGMEHGNKYDPEKPVKIEVSASETAVRVRITDQGGGKPIPEGATRAGAAPDLQAKLAGEQSPRGWGLFLIQNMVDEMNIMQDEAHHTVELVMRREAAI
jgi:anti-sigma regulatory factor (Ser/Thr protein kinase)